MHDGWLKQLSAFFKLDEKSPVDPELSAALAKVAEEHLARMDGELYVWISQERAANPALTLRKLSGQVQARIQNELTFWRVESMNSEHEAIWLHLLQQPAACLLGQTYGSTFEMRARQLQMVPKAQREFMVAAERELLKRWGTPRKNLPDVPLRSVSDQVADIVGNLKLRGNMAGVPPLVPFLAARLLDGWGAEDPLGWDRRCAQAQWWLRQQPTGSAAERKAAYTAFRLELAPSFYPATAFAPGKDDGYPQLASWFAINGVIKLSLKVDAQGQVLSASVLSRSIEVPGIRDNPPLAFITVFDKLAVSRALKQKMKISEKVELKDGFRLAEQEYAFSIKD